MRDELRAAAERIIGRNRAAGYWGSSLYCDDALRLAHAHLAEHPADDAEPVTEEWLRSVGFVPDDGDPVFIRLESGDGGRWMTYFTIEPCELRLEEFGNAIWLGDRTRGDVRRLCAALGIELRQDPH